MKTKRQEIGTPDNATERRAVGRHVVERRSGGAFSAARLLGRLGRSLALPALLALAGNAPAQVNSGSDGHDGAFNPTSNTIINMAYHPDGIYHYTSVFIPADVVVQFIPNANNTPVVWLVQSNCSIIGTVMVIGQYANGPQSGSGGPGGGRGGNSGPNATSGQGPGGGSTAMYGANASYGTLGGNVQSQSGSLYGNSFLIPLLGGSGGGGSTFINGSGGGGGGAILIAASNNIVVDGFISAYGGGGVLNYFAGCGGGGGGSGGGVRLVASRIMGTGVIWALGGVGNGVGGGSVGDEAATEAGSGRVRFDTFVNAFGGQIQGAFTQGFQPIIIPTQGQGTRLTLTSVGGVPISVSPTGEMATPDAVLSAQQNNPLPIVVRCSNIPLNTQITVGVKPANGATISAVGYNNTGTLASSTATISINVPRGGGLIYATAATAQ